MWPVLLLPLLALTPSVHAAPGVLGPALETLDRPAEEPSEGPSSGTEAPAPQPDAPQDESREKPAGDNKGTKDEKEDQDRKDYRYILRLRDEFPPGTPGLDLFWERVERENLTDQQLAQRRRLMEEDIRRLREESPQTAVSDPAARQAILARLSDYRNWAPLLENDSVAFLNEVLRTPLPTEVRTLAFPNWTPTPADPSPGPGPLLFTSASGSEEGSGEESAGRAELPDGFQIGRIQSLQQGAPDMSSPQPYQGPNAMESAITVAAGNGRGSGVVIWSDPQNTFALTAGHVTDHHRQVAIEHQGRTYNATVVSTYGTNPDIALLRIHTGGQELPYNLPAREEPRPGDRVVFIGQRYYEAKLTPKGAEVQGHRTWYGARTADVVIQPKPVSGDSGGPLINQDNCVAGICNSAEVYGPNGYFASVEAIHAILRNNGLQWLTDGTLDRPRELAHDFTFTGSDGRTHSLSSFRGRTPALIQLSADWCHNCGPATDQLLPALRASPTGRDMPVIMVLPHDTTEEAARRYAAAHRLAERGVHVVIDGEGENSVASRFAPGGTPSYPSFFLVDRDGGVAWTQTGYDASVQGQLLARLDRASQPGGFARQEFDRLFDGARQGPFLAGRGPGGRGPGGSCGPGGCRPGSSPGSGGATVPTSAPASDPPGSAAKGESGEGGGGCAVPRGGAGAGGPGLWTLALVCARLLSRRRAKSLPAAALAALLLAPPARAAEPEGASAPTGSPGTSTPTGTEPSPSGTTPLGRAPEDASQERPEIHPDVARLRREQERDPALSFPPERVELPPEFAEYLSARYSQYPLEDLSADERLSLVKRAIDESIPEMRASSTLTQKDREILRYYRGAWTPLLSEDQRQYADAALGVGLRGTTRLASLNPFAAFGTGLRDAVGPTLSPGGFPGPYRATADGMGPPSSSGRRGSTADLVRKDPSSGIGYIEPDRFGDFLAQAQKEGKTVLLDFSGTWCEYCKPAQGPLHDLQESHGEEGLLVVGVFNDSREDLNGGRGRSFFGGEAPNYAVVADEDGSIAGRYGVTGYPSFLLIGSDGRQAGGLRTGVNALAGMMREEIPRALASRPRREAPRERRPDASPGEAPRPPPSYSVGRITTPRGSNGGAAMGTGFVLESKVMTAPDGQKFRRLTIGSAGHVQPPKGGRGGSSIPNDSPPNDSNWPQLSPREPPKDGSYTIDLLVRDPRTGRDQAMVFTGGRPIYQGFEPSSTGLGEDRALFQFDVPADLDIPALPLAPGGRIPAGSRLYLYGFPGGQYGEKTVTTTRDVDVTRFPDRFRTITGGPTSGYSGGPIMNERGEVLGICTNAKCGDPGNPNRVTGGVYTSLAGNLGVRDMLRRHGFAYLIPEADASTPERGDSHGGFQEDAGPSFDGSRRGGPQARGPSPCPGGSCPSPGQTAPDGMFDGSGAPGSCGPGGCGPSTSGRTVPASSPPPADQQSSQPPPQRQPAPEEEEEPPPPQQEEKKSGGCAVPAGGSGGAGGPGLWLGALLLARLSSRRRGKSS